MPPALKAAIALYKSPSRALSTTPALIALAVFTAALAETVRFILVDYLTANPSEASLHRALRLFPDDAAVWELFAAWSQVRGGDPRPALASAVASDPLNSRAWMQLGLLAESHKDFDTAERDLLRAVEVDHQLDPRMALLYYYFRRADTQAFWRAARSALAVAPGVERPAIFQLCSKVSNQQQAILKVIAADPAVLDDYLRFLIAESQWQAAWPVAAELLRTGSPVHRDTLLAYCDRLLDEKQSENAAKLWRDMVRLKLLPYSSPSGELLVNGDFASQPTAHGFDWHLLPLDGVSIAVLLDQHALGISFSGKQPENCDLLWQWVALEQHTPVILSSPVRSTAIPPHSGLHWRLLDGVTGRELVTLDGGVFTPPSDFKFGRLVLTYRRALGTTRIAGWLQMGPVSLRPAR